MLTALEIKILAGLVLAGVLCAGLWAYDKHEQQIGHAAAVADQLAKDLATEKANRVESDRRTQEIQAHADVADQRASAARSDAVAARTAGDRLRVRLAAAERERAVDSPAAGASAPADTPNVVPFDVFEGVRSAAGLLGEYADQLRISLDACIGSYNSLTPAQQPH